MRRMMTQNMMNRRRWAALIGIGGLLLVGLALDLANQGLAWRFFWSQTGEESPLGQVRGMVEWAGNFTRAPLQTAPLSPINHAHENPYGINTFLQQEVEPEKRERIVQMASEAGFTWLRQQFPWEDIEIHGRGDFEDRRNIEVNGVISAWDKYDQIVDLAEQYNMNLLVRLDNPPAWTHSNPDIGSFAPPDDIQDYVNYAVAVAERYQGRLRYYQIWNEPNIYPEWGEQFVDAVAYTDLLCRTYTALKAVDPDIVVITGAIAPTISLDGMNLMDVVYLQLMYDAGAGACFDVLAAQGYGLNSGPTDRRMRITNVNYARHQYLRDVMVANGDAEKAIWITEAAWNPQPEDPSIVTTLYGNFGIVTEDQAARYMPLAYERAQQEWPWVGPIFYWYFKRPDDSEINQSWYYFRMVEPDFTPLPVYDTMRDFITTQEPVLAPGVYQAEHWAITLPDEAETVTVDGAAFATAIRTPQIGYTVRGDYDVLMRWRSETEIDETALLNTHVDADGWYITRMTGGSFFPTANTVPTQLGDAATPPFIVDSITVLDRTYERLFPLIAGAAIFLGLLLWVIVRALWMRSRR